MITTLLTSKTSVIPISRQSGANLWTATHRRVCVCGGERKKHGKALPTRFSAPSMMLTVFSSGRISSWRFTLTFTAKLKSFSNTHISWRPKTRSRTDASLPKDIHFLQVTIAMLLNVSLHKIILSRHLLSLGLTQQNVLCIFSPYIQVSSHKFSSHWHKLHVEWPRLDTWYWNFYATGV